MKKNTITWISLLVLIVPAVFMAQGRGAFPQGNPNPPTSPVTGNVTNGNGFFALYHLPHLLDHVRVGQRRDISCSPPVRDGG